MQQQLCQPVRDLCGVSRVRAMPRAGMRPGMSLLEVVFAVALLGMVAASIAGTFGFATMYQLRERQRLAATEVAHRLLLSYLDDPAEMPDPSLPVEYGPPEAPARFRWDYREDPIGVFEVGAEKRDQTRQSPLRADRYRMVTVRVWLSEESGGSRDADPSVPTAILARLIDPIAVRNPDSALNMLSTERGQRRWIEAMGMGSGGGGSGGGAGAAPQGRQSTGAQRAGGGEGRPRNRPQAQRPSGPASPANPRFPVRPGDLQWEGVGANRRPISGSGR